MIYEFYCNKCDTIFEEMHKEYTKEAKCPKCDNNSYKIISSPSFTINGYNEKNGYAKKEVKMNE